MESKKWIKIWFLTIIIMVIPIVGGFNYIIDPFDVFENKFFNTFQYKDRITSSIKLANNKYNNIIIGTSRTQGGMNVLNENLKGETINVSMSGTNVFEINKVFEHIYKYQNKNTNIIYGVDFLTFNDKRLPEEQFKQSLYNKYSNKSKLLISLLFSADAIIESKKTIIKNFQNNKNIYINGYKEKNFQNNFNYINAFDKVLINNFLVADGTYGCYNYGDDRLGLFEDIVSKSKNNTLTIFISPIHFRHVFALKHLGLFDIYIKWIKDLHQIVLKYDSQNGYNVKLYDFSYINSSTTEDISNDMKYYWESSHYKSIVGDKILDRIFRPHTNGTDFGILLNDKKINKYLERYITDYFDFMEKNKLEYNNVFNLYLDTTNKRIKNCKKYNSIQTILQRKNDYDPLETLEIEKSKSLNTLYGYH